MISSSFQGLNRLFTLLFGNEDDGTGQIGYCLPKVKIKDFKVKTDGTNFFDQPIND